MVTADRMPNRTARRRQGAKDGSVKVSRRRNGRLVRTARPAGPPPTSDSSDQLSVRPSR